MPLHLRTLSMRIQTVHIVLAFALGACSTVAAQSAATPTTPTVAADPASPRWMPPTSPPVTKADAAQRRSAPNGKGAVTILARGDNAFLARLELAAGAAVPVHRDATEEYIHLLEGAGVITIDGVDIPIGAGDTVYMPADAEVRYQNSDANMVALQVFAGPGPAAKYANWPLEE